MEAADDWHQRQAGRRAARSQEFDLQRAVQLRQKRSSTRGRSHQIDHAQQRGRQPSPPLGFQKGDGIGGSRHPVSLQADIGKRGDHLLPKRLIVVDKEDWWGGHGGGP